MEYISEDFSAVRTQKRPVKPCVFLFGAAFRGAFFFYCASATPEKLFTLSCI